jgi:Poly(ADP-ribose) polymerase and DNA-Ligase Zn-finger region./PADR1 (NUC008) domain.
LHASILYPNCLLRIIEKCGQVIAKGELRIGTHNEVDDKTFTSWNHVSCYQMTKRLKAEYSTNQTFLSEAVQDDTNDKILGTAEGLDEIAAVMGTKQQDVKQRGEKKRKHEQDDDSTKETSVLSIIKQNALTLQQMDDDDDDEEEEEKSESSKKKKKLKLSPTEEKKVEIYEKYAQCKVDDLKDVLRWNKVARTGTKDVLLLRLIDGEVYGRLGKCPICGKGQLKLNDEGTNVQCKGFYNEDVGAFEVCYFSIKPEKAPR